MRLLIYVIDLRCRAELDKLLGRVVPDASLHKVSLLAQRLLSLQPNTSDAVSLLENQINGTGDDMEFGADLVFKPPSRFLVDVSLEYEDLLEESTSNSSIPQGWYENDNNANYHPESVGGNFDLNWLRDACDLIVKGSNSQLPRDELAMAICRVLDSEKPGDEVLVVQCIMVDC